MKDFCTRILLLFIVITLSQSVTAQGQTDYRQTYFENFEEEDTEPTVFVPKGQWITGISVSYTQTNQNNYQFLILENLKGNTYSFQISPMVVYMFGDDIGAGGKFGYSRSLTKLEEADIVLDPDNSFSVDHLYRLAHNYYGMAVLRNYFALGNSKRFGVFNEVQIQIGGGQSKVMTGTGNSLSGTYERNLNMKIGLAPGLVMFLNNYSALEVNVGILGFSYTHTRSLRDQIYESQRRSKSANFRINLFSITFGVGFYL